MYLIMISDGHNALNYGIKDIKEAISQPLDFLLET